MPNIFKVLKDFEKENKKMEKELYNLQTLLKINKEVVK